MNCMYLVKCTDPPLPKEGDEPPMFNREEFCWPKEDTVVVLNEEQMTFLVNKFEPLEVISRHGESPVAPEPGWTLGSAGALETFGNEADKPGPKGRKK